MARKLNPKKKGKDVAKFGGTEQLGRVKLEGHDHEAASVEVQSKTNLEMDEGYGGTVTIRCFTYAMNPAMFQRYKLEKGSVSKQDIFNGHIRGIEVSLWADGWKVFTNVEPKISFNMALRQYSIYIAATPMKGRSLSERPQTLSEIVNG